MGKPQQKPAPAAAETPASPDLTLVENTPKPQPAKKQQADAGPPRNTTSNVWRDLHPARVWPD